ncbi:hypothetical protein HGRIS_002835 [Hohenbuehelia grisea]|uniref:Uncharacterized protein n=1 Tax=Hohenbuehelia grisea TaxID=104357 RepID=A0ABR3JMV7_9AGAR
MGFVAIAQDVVNLLRSLLVNSTYEKPLHTSPAPGLVSSLDDTSWPLEIPLSTVPSLSIPPIRPDQPRRRFWWRRFIDVTTVLFLVSLITGFVGNSMLVIQRDSIEKNFTNQVLRYVSCAVVVLITIVGGLVAIYARSRIPRVDRKGASFIIFLMTLLTIVGIYRLVIMSNYTTSMGDMGPHSLNTSSAKISFYICHVLPEWISAATLFGFNMREIFHTGLSGDNRWRDEHPDEAEERQEREEAKRIRNNQIIKITASSRFDVEKTADS